MKELIAGRETDVELAKLLGWTELPEKDWSGDDVLFPPNVDTLKVYNSEIVPYFTTRLEDSWKLFDFAHEKYGYIEVKSLDKEVCVEIFTDIGQSSYFYQVSEATGPVCLAICQAVYNALTDPMDERANVPRNLVFRSEGSYQLHGKTVFIVRNPRECVDFSWLVGQKVIVKGKLGTVKGVESRARAIKYKNEYIGLLLEDV